MFASSLLLSLALLPDAEAANIPKIKTIRIRQIGDTSTGIGSAHALTVLTPDADAEVASVAGELDGEPVSLTEGDAWVHGSAALSAEPADGAELTLTVYDADSAVIDTFTGTYTDGELTLTGSGAGDLGGGDVPCYARTGCETGTSSTTATDLEVLAAVVYGDGTVGLHFAGADAMGVASASLLASVTTTTEVCAATDPKTGECLKWRETTTKTTDEAEVDLDELGILWEGEVAAIDGVAELELKAYDAAGKKLDKAKVKLAAPWEDDGEGISVLPVDEDPLTTLGLTRYTGEIVRKKAGKATAKARTVVVSDGWTLGDALPEVAEIAVEGGETWSVPVNSYQITALVNLGPVDVDNLGTVAIDGVEGTELASSEPGRRRYAWAGMALRCSDLVSAQARTASDSGDVWATVTTWSDDPDTLPTDAVLTIDGVDTEVAFTDEVAVVFAMDVEVATDPDGLDVTGQVKLQGAANKKGKRETLVKGKFAGRFGVDGDGEPDLSAFDKNGDTVSRGDILIGGEPIDIERTGTPPVCLTNTFTAGQYTRMTAQCTTYR